MYRSCLLLSFLWFGGLCFAQSPSHLTTDLLEHTDRVFLDGYPSGIALPELGNAVERYQLAAIRNPKPCLGWVVNSNRPNTLQTAYQILVASSGELLAENEADMWDSGRTESDNSVAVPYTGKPLQPATVYYWKVKTWDNYNLESGFSQVKSFITAQKFDDAASRYPLQVEDNYPVEINALNQGRQFVDFGKDAFGRLKLTLTSAAPNDTVTIHLGEKLKDGEIDRHPGGSIRYAQYRLPLMPGTHTYSVKIRPDKRNVNPSSSGIKPALMPDYAGEVYPFRYCEIENYRPRLNATDIVRQMVHYPFNETASSFHSSDTVLNQVWELCKYTVKATSFAGVYIDGDRERIPYEADALINQLSHYAADREFSIARHSMEYLFYHSTWPSEWFLQSVQMAWYDYLYTGNPASLQRNYEALQAKTLMALKESNGLISSRTGKQTLDFLHSVHFKVYQDKRLHDIVDWPQRLVDEETGEESPGETDGFVFTDYNTVVNAYHYEALRLMSLIAETTGQTADHDKYAKEANYVRQQINKLLFNKQTGLYVDGIGTVHSALHANVFPMAFGIVPEKNIRSVREFIRSRGMVCLFAASALVEAVYAAEDAEYGLQLLNATTDRSWYNMIRVGTTITSETWDYKYKPDEDWNHPSGCAPGHLIPRKLMGIEPVEPGFRKIRIKPQPATLRQAEIKLPSIRGDIYVSFDNQVGERFALDVEIPANSVAEVWLPKLSPKYYLTVDDVTAKGTVDGRFVKVDTGSGKHRLVIEIMK